MVSGIGKRIVELLGDQYFTYRKDGDSGNGLPVLCRNNANNITLVLIRETIAPFVNRSNAPDETIYFRIDDEGEGDGQRRAREVVQVPARKFKSKEKLFGIKLLRYYGNISDSYRYNEISSADQLRNATSVLMGDTMVASNENALMIPARALYSDSYSLRDRECITSKLKHNALSEEGTMWDRKSGKNRTSLFDTDYVVPGVFIPSFITLKDPTPELLFHMLMSLKETTYGGATSITGPNFRNHLIGIILSRVEPSVTSYTVSKKYASRSCEPLNFGTVKDMVQGVTRDALMDGSEIILDGGGDERIRKLLDTLKDVPLADAKEAYRELDIDIAGYFEHFNFGNKSDNRGRGKGGKREKNPDESIHS